MKNTIFLAVLLVFLCAHAHAEDKKYHTIDEHHRFHEYDNDVDWEDFFLYLLDETTEPADFYKPSKGGISERYRLELEKRDWFPDATEKDTEKYDLMEMLRKEHPPYRELHDGKNAVHGSGVNSSSQPDAYFGIGFGVFSPGDEFSDDWGEGSSIALSLLKLFDDEHTALNIKAVFAHTSATIYSGATPREHDLTISGLEGLISFQPNNSLFQPFLAGGFGFYDNLYTIEEGGDRIFDEHGDAFGLVGEAGFRLVLDFGYFSFFGKYFSDLQVYEYPGGTEVIDFGGTLLGFEFGVAL